MCSGPLSKTMTRRNRTGSLRTRPLLSGCSGSIRVQKRSRRGPSSRRRQSSRFGPWYSEKAHHRHVVTGYYVAPCHSWAVSDAAERPALASPSCDGVLRRRGAVALSELVASVLSGFDVATSGLISFSFVLDVLGTTTASTRRSAVALEGRSAPTWASVSHDEL